MDNIIDADIHDYQHQDEETNHTKTQKLTGAQNSQVGSILSIPVGMGDKISAEVFAKYLPTNNQTNPTAAIASLISTAFTGGTGINNELTNQAINTSFNGGSMITNSANNYTYDDQGVMAFLNVLFVPEEAEATVNTEYFAFQQVSNGGTAHEQLSINEFVAPKAGYVLVYLTNEDPTYTEVYFDDLTITLNEHPVIQVDSYYPFGLTHSNSYRRVTAQKNKFLFGSKELQTDLDLGWLDFHARQYDPTLSKMLSIDPLSEMTLDWTPYRFGFNNPIRYSDPTGMSEVDENGNVTYNTTEEIGNFLAGYKKRFGSDNEASETNVSKSENNSENDDCCPGGIHPMGMIKMAESLAKKEGISFKEAQMRIHREYMAKQPGVLVDAILFISGEWAFVKIAQAGAWAYRFVRVSTMTRSLSTFGRAGEFGIRTYNRLRSVIAGTGLQAHHLIEQRFASTLGVKASEMLSIALTKAEHQIFTNAWRAEIGYNGSNALVTTSNATRQQILDAARRIYRDYPEILNALGL